MTPRQASRLGPWGARRGAIAMIFAICLLPMALLIGLSLDYSFYVQARQQATRAAEAAATQAVRTADGAYALDIDDGDSVATATSNAISAGQAAGAQWFTTQAGGFTRGSAAAPSVSVQTASAADGGAGFTAAVGYSLTYPPIFGGLFGAGQNWVYAGTSTAKSVYQYVEVLLLLDTSGSMLIGANPSDITALADNSVCFPTTQVTSTLGDLPLILASLQMYPYNNYASQMTTDGDLIDFSNLTSGGVKTYNDPSGQSTDTSGSCNTSKGFGVSINGNPASSPGAGCALACHTTANTSNGYYTDPYGQARRLGVTLREDVVLTAAEQVAQDLYQSEQTSDQFTLGVYQFNNDVSTIVDGGGSAEATTDLTDAKTTIEGYDYAYQGNSAKLPEVKTNSNPDTNFPLAITHLLSGTTFDGTVVPALQPVTSTQSNPAGSTAANPVKNIFIVTDGLEDSSSLNTNGGNGLTTDTGEMTSVTAETYYTSHGAAYSGNATGYCAKLKALGFNVYVLYVTYYPLPLLAYYDAVLGEQANHADATDYPSAFSYGSGSNMFPRALTQPTAVAESLGVNPDASHSATAGEVSPTEQALQACASKGDFYIASSATDITTAMTAMLRAATSSAIEVTK